MLTFYGCSFSRFRTVAWADNWPTARHENITMTFISPVAAKINACGPRAHQHAKSWHLRCVPCKLLGSTNSLNHTSGIENRIDLRSQLLVCAKTNCSCGMHLDELKKKDTKMQLRKDSFKTTRRREAKEEFEESRKSNTNFTLLRRHSLGSTQIDIEVKLQHPANVW